MSLPAISPGSAFACTGINDGQFARAAASRSFSGSSSSVI